MAAEELGPAAIRLDVLVDEDVGAVAEVVIARRVFLVAKRRIAKNRAFTGLTILIF